MACDDRQLSEAQRQAGYQNQRTGVAQALRPFGGEPSLRNVVDYLNRELVPAVRRTRDKVNDVYLPVVDNAPSGNPLAFYFSTDTAAADPTTGRVRLNASPQDTATVLRVSQTNGRLVDVAPWLDVMAGGATTPLGVVTLTDAVNPGRFIRADLSTMTDQGAYWDLGVAVIESSHDDPFVEDGPVVLAFIPGVGGLTPATVPPTSMSAIAGNTVLANATASNAAPTAFSIGANTVLGRAAGNIVSAQLVNAQIADATIANAKLANMAAARVKGVQVDGSIGAPQDLTGAEVAELLRRATVQTVAVSGDSVITLSDDTTVLVLTTSGTHARIRNIISNNSSGREIHIEHVRSSGAALVTLEHQSAFGGGGVDMLLPDDSDITLGHRDGAVLRYRPSFWRCQSRSGTFSSRFPGQPIYDVMAPPFNATGNGVADDTAALNAAIAAANADPGPIYLGEAHLVTAGLTAITGDNVFIVGRGEFGSGSRLIASGATPFDVITIDTANTSGVRNVQIEGPGTWASEGYGIRITDAFKTRVVGCRITGTHGAIEIYASVITEIIQVYLAAIDGPVGFYAHGSAADGENHALTFNACACGTDSTGGTIAWYKQGSYAHTFELINCGALEGGYGLLVEDDDPGANSEPLFTRTVNFQADHIDISGIRLAGGAAGRFTHTFITSTASGPGVDIASTYSGNWEFNGGEISGISGHGISVGVGDGIITGMQIGAIVSGSDCINVASGVTDFNLIGNSFGDMYASNSVARYGINIGASCDNYVVVGNRCLGNTTGAINNVPGTSTTRVVANNIPETTGTEGAVQTVSGLSGDITVTLADDTGVLLINSTADIRLQALISNNLANRKVVIEHVRTSGTGVLTLQHQSGVGGASVDFLLPNNADVAIGHRTGAVLRMRPNFWRLQATATGVFTSTQQGLVPIGGATTTHVLRADATFGTVATAGIADNAISNAKLRDSGALSVIGRSVNSSGDPADISATAASGAVLRESGSAIGFGTVATAGIANNAVTDAKIRQSSARSVIGRSASTSGDVADISTSSASGLVLREDGAGAIGFGQIGALALENNAITNAKLINMVQSRIKGRSEGAGTGAPEDLTPTQVVAIIDGESPTWTGSHSFTGANHTVSATGAVSIASSASSTTVSGGSGSQLILSAGSTIDLTSPTRLQSVTSITSVGTTAATAANDLAINTVGAVRFTGPANPLTGMIAISAGHLVMLVNAHASSDVVIQLESPSSAAANRFAGLVTDRHIKPGEMALAWYDGTSSRWRLLCRDEVDL